MTDTTPLAAGKTTNAAPASTSKEESKAKASSTPAAEQGDDAPSDEGEEQDNEAPSDKVEEQAEGDDAEDDDDDEEDYEESSDDDNTGNVGLSYLLEDVRLIPPPLSPLLPPNASHALTLSN